MSEQEKQVEIPAGFVALTTWGQVTAESAQSLVDTVRYNEQQGLKNLHYSFVQGSLVDKARNEAATQMLRHPAMKYVLFLDCDMIWAPNTIHGLLVTAFALSPWADLVGAWCPLRGKPYMPTIDPGSGTWESILPGNGPMEVIRTGSAAILVKRHVYEAMEAPWYGVRPAPRPLDVMTELDNYARCKFDGENPFRKLAEWDRLEMCARQDAQSQRGNAALQVPGGFFGSVGEDSNFCDKARALGFRVVVNTDIVVQHMEKRPITPEDHVAAMKENEKLARLAVGMVA